MAESGYPVMAEALDASNVRWDQLAEKQKDTWQAVARAMYVVVAARGGGKVADVKEPE